MSEPPSTHYFGDQIARRRHPINGEVISFDNGSINSSSNQEPDSLLSTGFSTYISSASQLWKITQNSIQNFAQSHSSADNHTLVEDTTLEVDEAPIFKPMMPFRDRTAELRTIAKALHIRQQPINYSNRIGDRERVFQSSIQFNQLARRIGRDLCMTCAKMEKLAQLAKKRNLFDDRGGEIEELSRIITQDIGGLNNQISNLQQLFQDRNNRDNNDKQIQDHSKLVVVGLRLKLESMGKAFKSALEIRTENLKLKRNRREKFSKAGVIPTALPSILLHDDTTTVTSVAVDMSSIDQQQIHEQALLIDEDDYHQSRYNTMETIESSISQLGVIFKQLASLVSEQGEMITRIDSNVEDTSMNIEAAHHELLKYFNNISKNRWLIIKVFGVLMAFFVFFIIFLA